MAEIVPAIIAKDFDELKKQIKLVEPHVEWVQLDVMDGRFAPQETWCNPEDLGQLKTSLNLEVHLMIYEPEKEISAWIGSGVKRILFHLEATEKAGELVRLINGAGLEAGVVLKMETPVEALDNLRATCSQLKVIQLMSIAQIGYHGQPFDERVIPKIKALRERCPDVKIAIDGGVSLENAPKTIEAGVDILAVGSTILKSNNIEETVKKLKQIK